MIYWTHLFNVSVLLPESYLLLVDHIYFNKETKTTQWQNPGEEPRKTKSSFVDASAARPPAKRPGMSLPHHDRVADSRADCRRAQRPSPLSSCSAGYDDTRRDFCVIP